MPDWKKLIEGKIALAKKGLKRNEPNLNNRIPAGQTLTTKFPILDLGIRPEVDESNWKLKVFGLVEKEIDLDWTSLLKLPQTKDISDFHCVTRWSMLDVPWEGVLARDILALAKPLNNAHYVTLHSYDDYTTNIPIEVMLDDDVIVAHHVFNKPLENEHGGPVRLVVPNRYAWKSAKWLKAIELHAEDRPGFWEVRGYHNDADPWLEERFSEN